MALIALIRRNGDAVPALIERIKKNDEFCFVVNQQPLEWHIALRDGKANALDHRGEILRAGGRIPCIVPDRIRNLAELDAI
jgi:hypothetical protein